MKIGKDSGNGWHFRIETVWEVSLAGVLRWKTRVQEPMTVRHIVSGKFLLWPLSCVLLALSFLGKCMYSLLNELVTEKTMKVIVLIYFNCPYEPV
ncbi:hypothetical protein COLO4_22331 [Corchorus olitorius]|uniref:Uncharacterized protein n=1 Tax=Corchorus olitorius TaxID=93759 RepID=A0A1R3IMW5_9ROSI|nr:hypothetical protein COLO4_22331 [Corchorus olitorius]